MIDIIGQCFSVSKITDPDPDDKVPLMINNKKYFFTSKS